MLIGFFGDGYGAARREVPVVVKLREIPLWIRMFEYM